jgi:U4/U6 small nuclear ribonucleoprotein PRP31
MSTLADELLNDFEDSGSEGEPESGDLFPEAEGHAPTINGNGGTMELDGDEEDVEEDEDMTGTGNEIDVMDNEEVTKAKVEKMQLGGVEDVRSVAGLMTTLEPVLEVSTSPAQFLL